MSFSIIFDMDGVIVDSNPYHKIAWKMFCEQHNILISDSELEKNVFGRTGQEALPILFKSNLNNELIKSYTEEIDGNFRKAFAPSIHPLLGLIDFLDDIQGKSIKYAIATSAPPVNVEFVLKNTGLRKYFDIIVDSTSIIKSKPNPEIYLKTANLLGIEPSECVVIEDSLSGIDAAIRAGMKVIGITTTHKAEELVHTNLVIDDFTELNLSLIKDIFNN